MCFEWNEEILHIESRYSKQSFINYSKNDDFYSTSITIILVVSSKEKVVAICIVLEYFKEYHLDVAVYFVGVRGIDLRFISSRKGNEWNKFIVCSTSKEGKKKKEREGKDTKETIRETIEVEWIGECNEVALTIKSGSL